MISIERKFLIFKTLEVHSAPKPYNIEGYDAVLYQYCKNKTDEPGFTYIKPHYTAIIDLTQDLSTIWDNIFEKERRYINRVANDDLIVEINKNYDEFYHLYRFFIQQKKIGPFKGVFNSLGLGTISIDTMKTAGTLFTVKKGDELLMGTFYLESPDEMIAYIGASKRLLVDKKKANYISKAHSYLIWNAIQYAKEKGIKEFDLGGIFSDEEVEQDPQKRGIRYFKMKFGSTKVTRHQYQKIHSLPMLLTQKYINFRNVTMRKKNFHTDASIS